MNKRVIVEMVNCTSVPLSQIGEIRERKDIIRVWTLYDENRVMEHAPFNPFTGKEVTSPLDAVLEHHQGVFLEDYLHDWNIRNNEFYMHSHVVGPNKPITVLIELR